jgi:hypothetical protein
VKIRGPAYSQYFETKGPEVFQKSRNHIKILGIMRVIQNNLHVQDPKILEATVKYLGSRNLYTLLFKNVLVSEKILTSINFEDTYRTVIFRE